MSATEITERRRQQTAQEEARALLLEIEHAIDQATRDQVGSILERAVQVKRYVRSREVQMTRLLNGEAV